MKPHFTIIGSITNELHITTSKSGIEYLQLDVDTVWTGKDQNGQYVDEKGTYRVLFYGEKATTVFSAYRQGDMVEVDCSLSSQINQGKTDTGIGTQTFINYTITGFRIERVRRFKVGHQQQPAAQPPQQRQQPAAPPQPPTPPKGGFQAPNNWGGQENFDDLPF